MTRVKQSEANILDEMPSQINDIEILYLLQNRDINWHYVNTFKNLTDVNDDTISEWLNLSVKTFREYRKPKSVFRENVKEHVLLLLALFKHGIDIFGSAKAFEHWLNSENFFFDNQKPESFLHTVTGIRFVDDRLTAMAFGDNV
jgi:uncharacterized protein (DUF2384 family)